MDFMPIVLPFFLRLLCDYRSSHNLLAFLIKPHVNQQQPVHRAKALAVPPNLLRIVYLLALMVYSRLISTTHKLSIAVVPPTNSNTITIESSISNTSDCLNEMT